MSTDTLIVLGTMLVTTTTLGLQLAVLLKESKMEFIAIQIIRIFGTFILLLGLARLVA